LDLLLLTLIAHVLSDFVLQSDIIAENKRNQLKRGYYIHIGTVFLCTYLLTHFFGLITFLLYSILIAFLHLIIDFIKAPISNCIKGVFKNKLSQEYPYANNYLSLFGLIIDQAVHLITILYIWVIFNPLITVNVLQIYKSILPATEMLEPLILQIKDMLSITVILLTLLIYIVVTFGGAILTRKVLECFNVKLEKNNEQIKTGKYIGILERFIILTLFLYGSLSSIAFVLTAKSIARFKELDNREFAEYYLLGTFTSSSIAILFGILLVKLTQLFI